MIETSTNLLIEVSAFLSVVYVCYNIRNMEGLDKRKIGVSIILGRKMNPTHSPVSNIANNDEPRMSIIAIG